MIDSVREGAAKRKEKAIKMAFDSEDMSNDQIGKGPSCKRNEKMKDKEKKRKGKLFDLSDLLDKDCDNIRGKNNEVKKGPKIIGEDEEDKEFEDFLKKIKRKKRFKSEQ